MLRLAVLLTLAVLAPGAAALSLDAAPAVPASVGVGDDLSVQADAAGQQVAVAPDGSASLALSTPDTPSLGLPDVRLAVPAVLPAGQDADTAQGGRPAHQATVAGVPAAVAAPAAAGAGAVALALLWRMLGASAPFAGRLFSRIETPRVLDNPVRSRLNDLVAARPGATLEDLRAASGIAWGTAVHHLRRLEAHGLVVSTTTGARHRFFPANTAASKHRASLASLAQPTAQRIARAVHDAPGIGQDQLCRQLGLNGPAASKHLGRFASQGLVAVRADGRRRLYTATDELRAALGLVGAPTAAPGMTLELVPAAPVAMAVAA